MATTNYEYGVYISHAEADKAWVQQNLIPRLMEASLKYCVDFEHFSPGAFAIEEAEKKIAASRKILLIISSQYLRNNFSVLENRIARYLDPSAKERRSIPVVISHCKLPDSIKQLVRIELTSTKISERDKEWSRLISHLKDEPVDIALGELVKPNKTKYQFITKIEKELRMKKYHWVQAGVSMPAETFSFTAVYLDNQLEVLTNIQVKLNSLTDLLRTKRVNPGHSRFMRDAFLMLDEIDSRSNQISEVLAYEDDHPLSIAAQKATENFALNSEILRHILSENSVRGIIDSSKVSEFTKEIVLQFQTLLISTQELQKHLKKIYKYSTTSIYTE